MAEALDDDDRDAWQVAVSDYAETHHGVVLALIDAFEATGGCGHDVGLDVLAVVVAWERIRTRETLNGLPALAVLQEQLEAHLFNERKEADRATKRRLWLQEVELSAMEGAAPKTEAEQCALIEAERTR